jgi:hypothetical protein
MSQQAEHLPLGGAERNPVHRDNRPETPPKSFDLYHVCLQNSGIDSAPDDPASPHRNKTHKLTKNPFAVKPGTPK